MLDRLQLSGGAHCFKITKRIPLRLIKDCLFAAEKGAVGNATRVIRQEFNAGKGIQLISGTLFRTEKLPSFLVDGAERDVRHCYALIAEIEDYIFVYKSGAKDFADLLEGYGRRVDGATLLGAFLEVDSDIEKFTAQAINTIKAGIRKQTLEGQSLQKSVSTIGSGNKILNNLQHKTRERRISVVGNSGRYNVRGVKGPVDQFIDSNLEAAKRFDNPLPQNDFLDNFPIELKLADFEGLIKPKEILLDTAEVLDFVAGSENPMPRLYYTRKDVKRYLPFSIEDYLEKLSDLMDIDVQTVAGVEYPLINNTLDRTLHLHSNTTKYRLHSKKFKNLYLEFSEHETENLQSLINRNQWFNVTFDKPDIHYSAGRLCKDNKLLGNINGFLQLFIADPLLNSIVREKGKITPRSKRFQNKTLFQYVESQFKPTLDHLILDDLGYEVADYIGVKNMQKIQVFHCKAGDHDLSASAFQEVVGQAVKNLGFFSDGDSISRKAPTWRRNYPSSQISRIRTADKKHFERHLKATLSATNCDKEIFLVVNFLSFSKLRTQLQNVRAGRPAQKSAVPLLWLLSSLKGACIERGIKIYICCKP